MRSQHQQIRNAIGITSEKSVCLSLGERWCDDTFWSRLQSCGHMHGPEGPQTLSGYPWKSPDPTIGQWQGQESEVPTPANDGSMRFLMDSMFLDGLISQSKVKVSPIPRSPISFSHSRPACSAASLQFRGGVLTSSYS